MPIPSPRLRTSIGVLGAGAAVAVLLAALAAQSQPQAPGVDAVRKSEAERVAVVEKVKPSVVAIFAPGGQGGGSGVLISKDGYALTNWHVVKGGSVFRCGLPDGILYHAVLVGLDKVGDVAVIKLLPDKAGQEFPCAVLGNSDTVREGDWSLAMGNPFLLATDFTPTVTFGMVSGVHRYQYPAGTLLEYTDCIQIDTSINPGNSGGPLFDMKGELIGINGRGSFDKRGRINSGVGYAISINQIKNFLGQMKAGLDTDHASLGATVLTQTDKVGLSKIVVNSILEDSDVFRRGMDIDDEVVTFDGRRITTANQLKNVLGLYPRGWRLPMEFRMAPRENDAPDETRGRKEVLVRLMGIQRRELGGGQPKPPPQPRPKIVPGKPQAPSPASKFFVAKAGFANYYFNQYERDRLLEDFRKHGDFNKLGGTWVLEGTFRRLKVNTPTKVKVEITEVKSRDGKSTSPVVRITSENTNIPDELEPLKPGQELRDLKRPSDSGGLLAALYVYHRLLTVGEKGFEKRCDHGGHEPVYPPRPDNRPPAALKDLRVEADVLNTLYAAYHTKWFFNQKDHLLRAFEVRMEEHDDPCEVYLSEYRRVDGRMLPHRMQVYHADKHFATFDFTNFKLAAK